MRKIAFFILILTSKTMLVAQTKTFEMDCGADTFFCLGLDTDTFHIGNNIRLVNGTAPYKFIWSCKPIPVTSSIIFTASNFLSDTSISNPYLKDFGIVNKPWCFYLTVMDNNNNIASDSIFIICSRFIYDSKEYEFYLNKGDSVQFYDEIFVGGGVPPLKYYWTPSIGLDDSTKINAWCKPPQSINYYQYIIDSLNCKSIPNKAYNIYVNPDKIENNKYSHDDLLNLRRIGNQLVFNNKENRLCRLSFFSIDGKKIYYAETYNSFYNIPNFIIGNKIIICVLSIKNKTTSLKIY